MWSLASTFLLNSPVAYPAMPVTLRSSQFHFTKVAPEIGSGPWAGGVRLWARSAATDHDRGGWPTPRARVGGRNALRAQGRSISSRDINSRSTTFTVGSSTRQDCRAQSTARPPWQTKRAVVADGEAL